MPYFPRTGLIIPIISVVDDDGRVIDEEQRRVIRHVSQRGRGADVIFANGTTGEWNRLSNMQRLALMEIAVSEVKQINHRIGFGGSAAVEAPPVEAWLGVNGGTRAEVLTNLDAAIELGADAAVIAPLAIDDLPEVDIPQFFRRDLNDLIESARRPLPVFLYDNADINAPRREKEHPHIRTRIVKELSRLPWVCGLKASSPRRVLDNYAQAALPFKRPGEFGLYVGNANLIFDWFRPRSGWFAPRHIPIGVVSGPANALPCEWQKAWRVCQAGDEALIEEYGRLATDFEQLTVFQPDGVSNQYTGKMIACLKAALEIDGVIDADRVAPGTPALNDLERARFRKGYQKFKATPDRRTDSRWQTTTEPSSQHSLRL
jgi:dihydrodipicolinate synthase/N-acetylneuraminate lyase